MKSRFILNLLLLVTLTLLLSACGKGSTNNNLDFATCQNNCAEQGYDLGTCLSNSEAGGQMKDNGNCIISDSHQCSKQGLCRCYCSYNPKDEIDTLLEDLKKQTKLDFDSVQPSDFEWLNSEKTAKTVQGKGFRILSVKSAEVQKIKQYFIGQGFSLDQNNQAAGTINSLAVYLKGDIICQNSLMAILDENDQPTKDDLAVIKVKCGKIVE